MRFWRWAEQLKGTLETTLIDREIMEKDDRICISWDFDDTLATLVPCGWNGEMLVSKPKFIDLLKEYHALGCKCIILTARTDNLPNINEINYFLESHDVHHAISEIVFTEHKPKGPFAKELNVKLHYDDDESQLESVRSYGIKAICSVASKHVAFI